jgi:replicative DNA helicase
MSNLQLVQRLISMESEIPSSKLRNGQLEPHEWQQLHAAIERMSKAPIYIDDTPGINIFELRAKCRRLKAQHDIQLIMIDYLQLMSGGSDSSKGGNREQEISQISRALKGLAKELNVPVIALSQLSRAVETRGGSKKPLLSDLRESGAIEQDADIIGFLYRPEYYGIMEDDEGRSTKGLLKTIIAKNRDGEIGEIDQLLNLTCQQVNNFQNYDEKPFPTQPIIVRNYEQAQVPNQITNPVRLKDEDIPF